MAGVRLYPIELDHAADHIRDFIAEIGKYERASEAIGINKKTIMHFALGYHNTRINIVEAYLNYYGYTLTVKKIGE